MKRENVQDIDIKKRMQQFGKIMSVWTCSECKNEIQSFLYNWEIHVPEVCPTCNKGEMIEDKEKRESPKFVNMIDKSREKNWGKGLSQSQQTDVLLGNRDPY